MTRAALPGARLLGRLLGRLAALAVLAWLAGFAWFAWSVAAPDPPPPVADGIVALTGGADRVATAFQLLARARGRQLLVSGVARTTDLAELARAAGVDPALLVDRTTLGHDATTTRGNAEETCAWARARGIRSLIVVTAAYHMPRALIELGRVLPEVRLYPVRVTPPALRGGARLATLRLLLAEYVKYLAASAGLTRLQPPAPAWRHVA